MKRQWFKGMPWDRVLSVNQNFCETQRQSQTKAHESDGATEQPIRHEVREPAGQKARQLWEQAVSQSMTLFEALDICRRCSDLAPFTFNNANTFASVGVTLLEGWLNELPSVEGQIARTTIGHYIADHMVSRRELVKVVTHFDARWRINGQERPLPVPTPSPDIQVQAQPKIAQA